MVRFVDVAKRVFICKIGADTAENEPTVANILRFCQAHRGRDERTGVHRLDSDKMALWVDGSIPEGVEIGSDISNGSKEANE